MTALSKEDDLPAAKVDRRKEMRELESKCADLVAENERLEDQVLARDAELWGETQEILALKAENERLKREDFQGMRGMLRAMQAGELTVSRGLEILNMWWAGNWNDNMLPPVRQDLIEEDLMPVEIIDQLKDQLTATRTALAAAEADNERLRKFVDEVAKQTPEKPDYWSSCSQCEHNSSEADDLITQPRDYSALREMIAEVYEECAKYFDGRADWEMFGDRVADDIRALAEKKLASLTS